MSDRLMELLRGMRGGFFLTEGEGDGGGSGGGSGDNGGSGDGGGDAGADDGGAGDGGKVVDWEAEAKKWKGLSRQHETEAKKHRTRAEELENAGKTELQVATDKAAAAETRATEAERRALVAEVAMAKGLTEAQAKRLVGTTREELEEDADELLESFKPSDREGSPNGSGRPKEKLRPGAAPDAEAEELDPAKLAEKIPRGNG